MTFRKIASLLTMTTAITVLHSVPAVGQTTTSPANPASEDPESARVPDIIVTAQRRGQNLQQVPIAVTAASGETLANLGIRSSSDLATVVPAVTFGVGLGGAAVTVRGVGGTASGTDESANALYVDGVYMPQPQSLVFQFNNIERVEVLKGPQGTLFGRNASGGLIQVITKDPTREPEARVEVGYSNYDTVHAAATVSGALTDTLGLAISGVYDDQRTGWGRNTATGNEAFKGRFYGGHAKLVWQIGPDTKLTAAALYAYNLAAGIQGSQILAGERLVGGATRAPGFYDQNANTDGFTRSTDENYALTINHDFDWGSFTSITSRDVVKFGLINDFDLSPSNVVNVLITAPRSGWTQEFQLASAKRSKVQWLVGLFYYRNDLAVTPFRTAGLFAAPLGLTYTETNAFQTTDSYAAYGQATVPVAEGTNVTVGLRYTIDKRKYDVSTSTSNLAIAPKVFPTATAEDKKLTWRFAVDQKLGDRALAYISYNRGFKSGLYNVTNPGTAPVRPQTIDAYEIGLKSELFDRRVRLNLSAFHYDVTDLQLKATIPGNATPIFYNAAKERVDGVDAEFTASVSSRLSVQANVSFLSASYSSFPGAVYYAVNTAPAFGLSQLPPGDASGKKAIFSPRWVTNLSAQYRVPTSAGAFTFAGTWNYNDGYYFDPQNRTANPSYHMINGTLTWEPKEGLFARVYVNNLLEEKFYTTVQATNFGDSYFPSAPRTYGVTFGVKF